MHFFIVGCINMKKSIKHFIPLNNILSIQLWLADPHLLPLKSLPARFRGLGIIITIVHFSSSFLYPTYISAPLVGCLLRKYSSCSLDIHQQMYQYKLDLQFSCRSNLSAQVDMLYDKLSPYLHQAFDAGSKQGALCWVTTLPIAEYTF